MLSENDAGPSHSEWAYRAFEFAPRSPLKFADSISVSHGKACVCNGVGTFGGSGEKSYGLQSKRAGRFGGIALARLLNEIGQRKERLRMIRKELGIGRDFARQGLKDAPGFAKQIVHMTGIVTRIEQARASFDGERGSQRHGDGTICWFERCRVLQLRRGFGRVRNRLSRVGLFEADSREL